MARKKKIKQKQTIVASDSKYEIHETSEKEEEVRICGRLTVELNGVPLQERM